MSLSASTTSGLNTVAPGAIIGFNAPPSSYKGTVGQFYFNRGTTPWTPYLYNGTEWILLTSNGADSFPTDSGTAVPDNGVLNIYGSGGITTSGSGHTVTITGSGAFFNWNTVDSSTNPNPMTVGNGYIANDNTTLVTLTLPATAAVGDIVWVVGKGTAGWSVLANAGQTVNLGISATTSGGSLSSTKTFDSLQILCITANTEFSCITSDGNITLA